MIDPAFLSHSPAAKQWHRIGVKHHHGLVLPLFSLHSSHSYGIGEFPDLIPMIEWCHSLGFDVIQLLPINDTGLGTSPYSALSAFALNPIYLGLSHLPYLEGHPLLQDELKALPKLSRSPHVEYNHVRENKERFLKHYFQQVGKQILGSEEYAHFIQKASWLKGFAVYKTLKSHYQWANWESWPTEFQNPTPELIDRLAAEHQEDVEWHCLLQFLCDRQLHRVKEYANHHRVFLMGDIPILIDRDSADVWLHRSIFDLNYSAGSPPDMFSKDGQNWGFPIYNWEQINQEGFRWWIDRLQWASRYYHIYRLDHIVGFFRIWAIPRGLTGKDGYFIPRDPATWIDHGQRILLTMMRECDMLPIGEDLGVVPLEVRACLSALGICGTRVMRWERMWREDSRFIPTQSYSPDAMTTVSTHDSEPLQLWWQNNEEEAQSYAHFKGWTYQPILSRDHHREILWDSHHSSSLFHINLLQEYLALIPGLTWPSLEDERINVPGILSDQNWSYRFKPTIEELIDNQTLKHTMQSLII
ncbi:4-alpha-glucanotransferase [Candidatus Protochlamydia phocaeensis]|uniref:4-alpha-glucanotransferase n=1 Tax=Candidatus Protochlamydia phocaeensis TaxID=1414722 RepID=UPI0009ABC91F|nr:4-alpha-glucanotransferase [Candidatus Protochlamydia phocaeensis]